MVKAFRVFFELALGASSQEADFCLCRSHSPKSSNVPSDNNQNIGGSSVKYFRISRRQSKCNKHDLESLVSPQPDVFWIFIISHTQEFHAFQEISTCKSQELCHLQDLFELNNFQTIVITSLSSRLRNHGDLLSFGRVSFGSYRSWESLELEF